MSDDTFFSFARAARKEATERDPVVGDTVHFWDGDACNAAIVTRDDLTSVCLTIFWPEGVAAETLRASEVEHDEAKGTDTWHWPELD